MSIVISCPGCKKSFKVDDKFAGKTGPCPNCKIKITVPAKGPEVVVHEPEVFGGGGRSTTGKLVLKPIDRQPLQVRPLTWAIIGGGAVAAVAYALMVRYMAPESGSQRSIFDLQSLLSGLGLLLLAPPLAVAAYAFLHNDELEPYRGLELWIRAGICGLVYAILWAGFAYIRIAVFKGETIPMPIWFFLVPPFFVVGSMAGKYALDLETTNGFFHYAFYVAVTVLLGAIAGVSGAIWN